MSSITGAVHLHNAHQQLTAYECATYDCSHSHATTPNRCLQVQAQALSNTDREPLRALCTTTILQHIRSLCKTHQLPSCQPSALNPPQHFDKLRDRSTSGGASASKPAAPQQQPELATSSSEPATESAAAKPEPAEAGASKPSASRDIAALLAAEVAGLKDKKLQRFKLHQTGIKGTIYIMFMGEPGA